MPTKEDIFSQFQLFNIEPGEEVLSKCMEMCSKYNVDGEDMVDHWFAYTASVLKGAAPTVEYLEQMERRQFMTKKRQDVKRIEEHRSPVSAASGNSLAPNVDIPSTPKGNHAPSSQVHTLTQSKKLLDDAMDVTSPSPNTPSAIYSKRSDALSVRCCHGSTRAKFIRNPDLRIAIRQVYEDGLKSNQKIMYEILRKRSRCIDNMTEDLAQAISKKYNLTLSFDEEELFGVSTHNKVLYGRIIPTSDGKMNHQSVVLELTQKFRGRTVNLNLSKISKYSLFPGQVVVAKGSYVKTSNEKDDMLVVEDIYVDTDFSLPNELPRGEDTLQLAVACGPFTLQENLSFEPLNDLLQYLKEHKPHVLILTGPFYDKNHQGIFNGELRQSLDTFFFEIIDNLMGEIPDINVLIVSSQKEPHHFPMYPTPPYEVRQKYPNLTFMPDPCMVNINGLVIGITTPDVLFDIGNFEVHMDRTNSGPPDRMGRLASHLLKQQSFYPLDPPGKDVHIDFSLMERDGVMGVKPHVLILPSNLRHFVKEIHNCVVINPERLTKGHGGGTFARVEISPGSNRTVCGRTICQVLKI